MKKAIVYDRVNKFGGAERILKVLHEMDPRSPLYTAVYHPKKANWAKGINIVPSFINKIPFANTNHELFPWLTPLAFESFDFNDFDLVLSVTSAEAKGIITAPKTLHVCYCLTPIRYLWHDYNTYIKEIPSLFRPFTKPVYSYLRNWDKIASFRPDAIIAISKVVKMRIKKYYNRDSDVIYPPVDIDSFAKVQRLNKKLPFTNFYLVVSRLVAYKKVEIVIKACNQLNRNLVIVGVGVKMEKLKKIAGPSIYFAGKLTEAELVMYYQNCNALIFPQTEDFGITLVEAQAAGKPVIAFNKGGALEIIKPGETGLFFSRKTTQSLVKTIQQFEKLSFNSDNCKTNAKRFSKAIFIKEFSKRMEELWQQHKLQNVQ